MRDEPQALQDLLVKDRLHAIDLGNVHRCFDVPRAEPFVAGMRLTYERDPDSFGPNPRANYEMGAKMSLLDAAWAQTEQTQSARSPKPSFDRFDVVLSATTPVSPFTWSESYAAEIDRKAQPNYYRWLALTYLITLTTHPAISLPCGGDESGMPFGL